MNWETFPEIVSALDSITTTTTIIPDLNITQYYRKLQVKSDLDNVRIKIYNNKTLDANDKSTHTYQICSNLFSLRKNVLLLSDRTRIMRFYGKNWDSFVYLYDIFKNEEENQKKIHTVLKQIFDKRSSIYSNQVAIPERSYVENPLWNEIKNQFIVSNNQIQQFINEIKQKFSQQKIQGNFLKAAITLCETDESNAQINQFITWPYIDLQNVPCGSIFDWSSYTDYRFDDLSSIRKKEINQRTFQYILETKNIPIIYNIFIQPLLPIYDECNLQKIVVDSPVDRWNALNDHPNVRWYTITNDRSKFDGIKLKHTNIREYLSFCKDLIQQSNIIQGTFGWIQILYFLGFDIVQSLKNVANDILKKLNVYQTEHEEEVKPYIQYVKSIITRLDLFFDFWRHRIQEEFSLQCPTTKMNEPYWKFGFHEFSLQPFQNSKNKNFIPGYIVFHETRRTDILDNNEYTWIGDPIEYPDLSAYFARQKQIASRYPQHGQIISAGPGIVAPVLGPTGTGAPGTGPAVSSASTGQPGITETRTKKKKILPKNIFDIIDKNVNFSSVINYLNIDHHINNSDNSDNKVINFKSHYNHNYIIKYRFLYNLIKIFNVTEDNKNNFYNIINDLNNNLEFTYLLLSQIITLTIEEKNEIVINMDNETINDIFKVLSIIYKNNINKNKTKLTKNYIQQLINDGIDEPYGDEYMNKINPQRESEHTQGVQGGVRQGNPNNPPQKPPQKPPQNPQRGNKRSQGPTRDEFKKQPTIPKYSSVISSISKEPVIRYLLEDERNSLSWWSEIAHLPNQTPFHLGGAGIRIQGKSSFDCGITFIRLANEFCLTQKTNSIQFFQQLIKSVYFSIPSSKSSKSSNLISNRKEISYTKLFHFLAFFYKEMSFSSNKLNAVSPFLSFIQEYWKIVTTEKSIDIKLFNEAQEEFKNLIQSLPVSPKELYLFLHTSFQSLVPSTSPQQSSLIPSQSTTTSINPSYFAPDVSTIIGDQNFWVLLQSNLKKTSNIIFAIPITRQTENTLSNEYLLDYLQIAIDLTDIPHPIFTQGRGLNNWFLKSNYMIPTPNKLDTLVKFIKTKKVYIIVANDSKAKQTIQSWRHTNLQTLLKYIYQRMQKISQSEDIRDFYHAKYFRLAWFELMLNSYAYSKIMSPNWTKQHSYLKSNLATICDTNINCNVVFSREEIAQLFQKGSPLPNVDFTSGNMQFPPRKTLAQQISMNLL